MRRCNFLNSIGDIGTPHQAPQSGTSVAKRIGLWYLISLLLPADSYKGRTLGK